MPESEKFWDLSPEKAIDAGLDKLSAAFDRTVGDKKRDYWKKRFGMFDPKVMERCFDQIAEEDERFPNPKRFLQAVREAMPQEKLTRTEGADKNGVPCWFWSDEPSVPAYLGTDCPEGQAGLVLLREIAEQADGAKTRVSVPESSSSQE